jgi:phosphate transport system substrate-binding protein
MYAMKRMNNDMAVSPIVATLVLIVVAVIGAVAVGTIMGSFSTQVSKQANAGQASSASQTEILVAGSTTLQPVEINLASDYAKINPGIQVNVQGGSSGVGVTAVATGIADIGASSAAAKITAAQTANAGNPGYQNLYAELIGGRAVAWITNAASPAVASGTVNASDLQQAYGTALGSNGTLPSAIGSISGNAIMVSRSDSSGTEDDASQWLFGATSGHINTSYSVGETGNEGIRSYIASTAHTLGFCDAGWALTNPSGIEILNVTDWTAATSPDSLYTPAVATGTVGETYGAVTNTEMKDALKDWYFGSAQDHSSSAVATSGVHNGQQIGNYPQGLVGGMYWITPATVPTVFTARGTIQTQGSSSASSTVKDLMQFAVSPVEQPAFDNVGDLQINEFAST